MEDGVPGVPVALVQRLAEMDCKTGFDHVRHQPHHLTATIVKERSHSRPIAMYNPAKVCIFEQRQYGNDILKPLTHSKAIL